MTTTHDFPLPHSIDDIITVAPSRHLSRQVIFSLLSDPGKEDWRHKVGPASPLRLLLCQGWVLKARESNRTQDLAALRARIVTWNQRASHLGIWHPAKHWFIVRCQEHYWPCNATPHLATWPELRAGRAALNGRTWLGYLQFRRRTVAIVARVLVRHAILLDPKLRNFGLSQEHDQVYYIDDEVYGFTTWQEVLRLRYRVLA